MSINKDTIIAIFLLLFCGIMINSSFDIEDPGYQGMKASFWPTIVLCLLSVMSLVMLIKSMVSKSENNLNSENTETNSNIIKDVNYVSKDKSGNEYVLFSKEGQIDISDSEKIFLTDVKAIINLSDGTKVDIKSDFGKYNSINYYN